MIEQLESRCPFCQQTQDHDPDCMTNLRGEEETDLEFMMEAYLQLQARCADERDVLRALIGRLRFAAEEHGPGRCVRYVPEELP